MDLPGWFVTAADAIAERLVHAPAVQIALANQQSADRAVHLAVLVEPFLGFVLDGTKTIESRFSSVRASPYCDIEEGDVLLLKAASGPIVAASTVQEVWFFGSLTHRVRADIHQRFGADLRDDVPGFWEARRASTYATLMRLGEVAPLHAPVECPKNDRRGWVVLRGRPRQLSLLA